MPRVPTYKPVVQPGVPTFRQQISAPTVDAGAPFQAVGGMVQSLGQNLLELNKANEEFKLRQDTLAAQDAQTKAQLAALKWQAEEMPKFGGANGVQAPQAARDFMDSTYADLESGLNPRAQAMLKQHRDALTVSMYGRAIDHGVKEFKAAEAATNDAIISNSTRMAVLAEKPEDFDLQRQSAFAAYDRRFKDVPAAATEAKAKWDNDVHAEMLQNRISRIGEKPTIEDVEMEKNAIEQGGALDRITNPKDRRMITEQLEREVDNARKMAKEREKAAAKAREVAFTESYYSNLNQMKGGTIPWSVGKSQIFSVMRKAVDDGTISEADYRERMDKLQAEENSWITGEKIKTTDAQNQAAEDLHMRIEMNGVSSLPETIQEIRKAGLTWDQVNSLESHARKRAEVDGSGNDELKAMAKQISDVFVDKAYSARNSKYEKGTNEQRRDIVSKSQPLPDSVYIEIGQYQDRLNKVWKETADISKVREEYQKITKEPIQQKTLKNAFDARFQKASVKYPYPF